MIRRQDPSFPQGMYRLFPIAAVVLALIVAGARGENLVRNGSFEEGTTPDGVPIGWKTSGTRTIRQTLTVERLPDGGHAARLECTRFSPGSPSSHAMACQYGVVEVHRGQWYRIRWRARARELQSRVVGIAVRDTKTWQDSGVTLYFSPETSWRAYERLLQASQDVPQDRSRLQIWFHGTGTLWLDDITIEPVNIEARPIPEVSPGGNRNLVPNASFECGTAGWGAFSPEIRSWGNVFRLPAEVDAQNAAHGKYSLRIQLPPPADGTLYFDYFEPLEIPIRSLIVGNRGWIPVEPDRPYVLSCRLRAEKPGTPVRLYMRESSGRTRSTLVKAGPEWGPAEAVFRPKSKHVWIGVGPDLRTGDMESCRVWLDAVVFEPGTAPGPFRPRADLELFLIPGPGGQYVRPGEDVSVQVLVRNDSAQERSVNATLRVTDFFGKASRPIPVRLKVPPGQDRRLTVTVVPRVEPGWYRIRLDAPLTATGTPQAIRVAAFEPYKFSDATFGINHAYPWQFMLDLMGKAGVRWVRDWSVKWHSVQPEAGAPFDFRTPDAQIERVLDLGLKVLVLLPFPSAPWASEADPEAVAKAAAGSEYLRRRYVVAYAARDRRLFREYVAASVRHYRQRVRVYEILNEPVYTTYALPRRFGYEVRDYVEHLKAAYQTIHKEYPDALVIGGIAAWADSVHLQKLIDAGGLEWMDALNLHLYPYTIDPVRYQSDLETLQKRMRAAGRVLPIWVTEFGCYADDDPERDPPAPVGDGAMQRANWPDERAAAEAFVKTMAVFLSHGVEKVFLHAGTSGRWNGKDANTVFFEYGGAPRKLLAATAAMANFLGPDPRAVGAESANARVWYALFQTDAGAVAVAWNRDQEVRSLRLPPGVEAFRITGAPISGSSVSLGTSPVYFRTRSAENAETLRRVLSEAGEAQ